MRDTKILFISEPPRSLFLAQDSIWVIAVVLCEDLVSTKNSDQGLRRKERECSV